MEETEFDRFAEEYVALHAQNIALSGETPRFFAAYKVADTAEVLAAKGLTDAPRILDFGAGVGTSVAFFHDHFPTAKLTCLDVSRKSLQLGKARCGDLAEFVHFDGKRIPFPDCSFDLVFMACVLHHVDHAEHLAILAEARRVLVEQGVLVIFEHNPLNPLTVHTVSTCVFDENAQLVSARRLLKKCVDAGFSTLRHRYRIFFPGRLRRLRPLERFLGWLPLGAQYLVVAER
jgi:SAM-dependent methyltransferase